MAHQLFGFHGLIALAVTYGLIYLLLWETLPSRVVAADGTADHAQVALWALIVLATIVGAGFVAAWFGVHRMVPGMADSVQVNVMGAPKY